MRQPRIKQSAETMDGIYHCWSRTVNKERLFGDVEKEVFRKQLWQVADFCGVQVLTYAVMENHFHVLARIPPAQPVTDAELLRRYEVLYPKPTRFQTARLSVIRQQLATDGPEAVAWRQRLLALMADVSPFMQLLKQRFSIWFNRTHHRCGTLWSERFGSSLLEPVGHSRKTVAAYVDLNAVRAGLVQDPLDYRFCGYAEAVAGSVTARAGLMQVTQCPNWNEAQASYRQWLFGTGSEPRAHRPHLSSATVRASHAGRGLPLAVTTPPLPRPAISATELSSGLPPLSRRNSPPNENVGGIFEGNHDLFRPTPVAPIWSCSTVSEVPPSRSRTEINAKA